MEHLTVPSVGAKFKKWGCCTPILPKALAHSPNFPKKLKRIKNFKNKGIEPDRLGVDLQPAGDRWSPPGPGPSTYNRRSLVAGPPETSAWSLVAQPQPGPNRSSLIVDQRARDG
jgi:hypothetical protein